MITITGKDWVQNEVLGLNVKLLDLLCEIIENGAGEKKNLSLYDCVFAYEDCHEKICFKH